MKKIEKKLLLFTAAMALTVVVMPVKQVMAATNTDATKSVSIENTKYVSLSGHDKAAGTSDDPYATIQEATDSLANKTSADHPGTILIRGGDYKLSNSVQLNSDDSYITYSAYNNEKVTLSGAASLNNNNFKKISEVSGEQYSSKARIPQEAEDKVYVYDLKSENIPVGSIQKNGFNWVQKDVQPELVVDGAPQTLAQYPNDEEYITRDMLLCGIEKNQDRLDSLTVQERANYDAAQVAGAYAEHASGEVPAKYFFNVTDNVKSYEEMLKMKPSIFYAATDDILNQMKKWAPATTIDEPAFDQADKTDIDNTKVDSDGWLSGYFENNYANDMVKIYSIDSNKRLLYTKYPSRQGVQDKNLKLKAVNLLSELDKPGEYYIDRYNDNNVLYYYPKEDTIQNKSITLTSLAKPLLTLEGTTGVTIKDLNFEAGTGYGTTLSDTEDCTIDHCEYSNFSLDAVKIGQNNDKITTDPSYETSHGGHNNKVTNCTIHDIGGGGVYMAGGNEKTLERGNNLVANCEISNISRMKTYTPAVYLEGVGNTAENNYIHDAPHMVIQIMGNDMLVTKNRIENTCTNASDMAPIYAGRCWTWLGNVISYNYIKGVKNTNNYGVYLDDNMSGATVKNNIFEDISSTAVFSNKGFGQDIENNVMITNNAAVQYATDDAKAGARPIPNERVLQIRYDAILKSGDGTNFTNTDANISNWYDHYKVQYPYMRQRFIPAAEAVDQGTNPNSILVPNHQKLNHQVIVGTGDFVKADSSIVALQDKDFNTASYQSDSVAALGLDTTTGKFNVTSPLAKDANFGSGWITDWNEGFDLSQNGVQN